MSTSARAGQNLVYIKREGKQLPFCLHWGTTEIQTITILKKSIPSVSSIFLTSTQILLPENWYKLARCTVNYPNERSFSLSSTHTYEAAAAYDLVVACNGVISSSLVYLYPSLHNHVGICIICIIMHNVTCTLFKI